MYFYCRPHWGTLWCILLPQRGEEHGEFRWRTRTSRGRSHGAHSPEAEDELAAGGGGWSVEPVLDSGLGFGEHTGRGSRSQSVRWGALPSQPTQKLKTKFLPTLTNVVSSGVTEPASSGADVTSGSCFFFCLEEKKVTEWKSDPVGRSQGKRRPSLTAESRQTCPDSPLHPGPVSALGRGDAVDDLHTRKHF